MNEHDVRERLKGGAQVKDLSDRDLEGILRERRVARAQVQKDEAQQANSMVEPLLQQSADVQRFVRLLMPPHSRKSCSDDNLANAFASTDMCPRCTLLEVMLRGVDLDTSVRIVLDVVPQTFTGSE